MMRRVNILGLAVLLLIGLLFNAANAQSTRKSPRKIDAAATKQFISMDLKDTQAVRQVVARGADVNARREKGGYALCVAAFRADSDLALVLLDNGADPNIRCTEEGLMRGNRPLHMLALDRDPKYFEKSPDVAKLLLHHGADVNARTDAGTTPLDIAASTPIPTLAAALSAAGGKPNCDPNRNPRLSHDLCGKEKR